MCGLVGVAGDLSYRDEAMMRRLLLLDYFRGVDSTGFAAVRRDNNFHIAKVASHPIDLYDMGKFKSALNGNLSKVFIGHNRAATRGEVNTFNAHPFEFDNIVGAHNGTLEYQAVNRLEDALGEKFPVDSMALLAGIAKLGLEETIGMINGAWALTWFDRERNTLNFLRNDQRPLWYSYEENFQRVFWASEWEMMDNAMLNTPGAKNYRNDKGFRFFQCEPDIHYEFDLAAFMKVGEKQVPKPKAQKIEARERPKSNYQSPTYSRYNGAEYDPFHRKNGSTDQQTSRSTTTTSPLSLVNDNMVHIPAFMEQPYGKILTRERFDAIAKYGCGWCGCDVSFGDLGVTVIERDESVLCRDCSTTRRDDSVRVISQTPLSLVQ